MGDFVLPNLGPIDFGAAAYLNASMLPALLVLTEVPAAAFISLVTPLLSLCLRVFCVECTPVGPVKNDPVRAIFFLPSYAASIRHRDALVSCI